MRFISAEMLRKQLTWQRAIDALRKGHEGPHPKVQDVLLTDAPYSLFGRAVILPGHGAGMKVASIFPPNATRAQPTQVEHAIFAVIDEEDKRIKAIVDGPELTRWKTAADSALGSSLLSREDSETLLVLGAGPIAAALAEAHLFVRPNLKRVLLWNRTAARLMPLSDYLAKRGHEVEIVADLPAGLARADIISAATGTETPLVLGESVRPGCHVDLVGGFTPMMREADDALVKKAQVYVNCRATAIEHTGDICQPIVNNILTPDDILGDLFEIVQRAPQRQPDEVTLYKNAGGAHIDLLVASALL